MLHQIVIPQDLYQEMKSHLFQSDLEQGAFLLAQIQPRAVIHTLVCSSLVLIPPSGWDIQESYYLQMSDAERGRIMKIARDDEASLIECHSHPGTGRQVQFSFSDHKGLADFVQYAKWKLNNRPYGAVVWGEYSFDGRVWYGDFKTEHFIDQIIIRGNPDRIVKPTAQRKANPYARSKRR